jgi:hypothetical protein
MLAGRAQISIHADGAMGRNTSRYLDGWRDGEAAEPSLTATANGDEVTFAGTGGAGQVAGVTVGDGLVPVAYAHRVLAADTPASVAAAFAALIDGATADGAVLTVPGTAGVLIVADLPGIRVLRQQEQGFRITAWCPTPAARDVLAGVIDTGLTDLRRFDLPDGSMARIAYRGTVVLDPPQKSRIWRRDLLFMVEYATTAAEDQAAMLFGTLGIGVRQGASEVPEVGDIAALAGPASPRLEIYTDEDGNVLMDAGGNMLGPVPE